MHFTGDVTVGNLIELVIALVGLATLWHMISKAQEEKHKQNSQRITAIEASLLEIKTEFKLIRRWFEGKVLKGGRLEDSGL